MRCTVPIGLHARIQTACLTLIIALLGFGDLFRGRPDCPLFLILLIIRFNVDDIGASAVRFYTIETIAYIIGWVLFPLVVFYLVETLGKQERYAGFIIAYNWAAVLQNGFYLPFAILFQLGLIPGEAAGLLNLLLLGLVLAYTWFVAKSALDISGAVAGGIIILDVGLWVALTVITESFLRSAT